MWFSISAVLRIFYLKCDRFLIILVIRKVNIRITNHFIVFPFSIYYDKLDRKCFLIAHFYLPHRETIASPVRNKSMHTEEHLVGFKAMNSFRIEKDAYPVWFYVILGCFLYAHAFICAVYFLVRYFLTSYFPAKY